MVNINIDDKGNDGLPINEFDLNQMVKNPAIVMIAKRGSGKSYICRSILQHFRDIPCGVIISKTDRMSSFYGTFFPESYIFFEYKTEIMERILRRQEMIIEKKDEKKKIGKIVDPRTYIVMDDCLSSKGSWMRDKPILELLFNGRHYEIMYILTMQFPLGIPPDLRINFDYIFLMAEDTLSNLKRIFDHYAGCFPNFYAFKKVFTELTKDYGALVIVNRGIRNNLFEKIFHYKAEDFTNVPNVDFGCKQFRNYHDKNYDKNWRKRTKVCNIEEMFETKKKNNSNIKVKLIDNKNT